MRRVSPAAEVARFLDARVVALERLVLRIVSAAAEGRPTEPATIDLADALRDLVALSDLLGRARVEEWASGTRGRAAAKVGNVDIPGLPWVSFAEAVEALASRIPQLLEALPGEDAAEAMRRIYESRGFSLARSASAEATRRTHAAVAEAMASGLSASAASESVQEALGAWSRGYAEVVYRNNVQQAYTDGVFAQVETPGVSAIVGALLFDAVGGRSGDGNTTAICRAFHGTLAVPSDQIWRERRPPCHHNCRSGLQLVTWPELDRMGALKGGQVVRRVPFPSMRAARGFGRGAA